MKTAYDELGVRPDAHDGAIRTAYLNAARAYHPDRNSDDSTATEHFKRINAAHDILKSPSRRAAYDQYLLRSQQRMRRERNIKLATYASACLIGVSLATGPVVWLRQWSSTQHLPLLSFVAPVAEPTAPKSTTQEGAIDRQPGSRSDEGPDNATVMLAPNARPRDFEAIVGEAGWPSTNQPPTNPVATRTDGDIISGAVKTMTTQDPARGHTDENGKAGKRHEGFTIASRVVETGVFKASRANPVRAMARRRSVIHPDRVRPLAWLYYTASLKSSPPRRHSASAEPAYQLDYANANDDVDASRWSALARITRRRSAWQETEP